MLIANIPYPELDRYDDQGESEGLAAFLDRRGAEMFMENPPSGYYPCPKNAELLENWIRSHGAAYISARNLSIAYEVLSAAGKLDKRPEPKPEPPRKPTLEEQGIIDLRNVRVARDSVTPEDRAKYADKPLESDVERKTRDEALRWAAVKDRLARQQKRK